jgi:immune inhibitor A
MKSVIGHGERISAVAALCAVVLLTLSATSFAVAPRPGLMRELRAEGRLEPYLALLRDAKARGMCAPVERPKGATPRLVADGSAIDYRVLCILVDFSDNPGSGGLVASTPNSFDSLLFSSGLPRTAFYKGSFKEFYEEISYHKLEVTGQVVGWYRMPLPYSYYMNGEGGIGAYPHNSQAIAETAIDSAAEHVNFSQFDNDNDGYVDGVIIVVPGVGAEETGNLDAIHSHRWTVPNPRTDDGKVIRDYTIQPEETTTKGGPLNSIGVFCHEWGHIFHLPDLYDLDDPQELCGDPDTCDFLLSHGLGDWSLMALGNWLPDDNSYSPAHPDAWCRIQMDFATPIPVESNQTNVSIPSVETSETIYRIWEGGAGGPEYFLVTNRDRAGFDASLPGEGLLIYHVDETQSSNRNQWIEGADPYGAPHYAVALEQADGFFSLEKNGSPGSADDPYFADSAGFDQISYPSSRKYNGEPTQVAVWNISESGDTMTANFDVAFSRPYLETSSYAIDDPEGDGDGVPEAGETFELTFDLSSLMKEATDITVTVSAPGSDLTFVDDTYTLGTLGTGGNATNSDDPFKIAVPDPYRSKIVTFLIETTAEGGTYHWTSEADFAIGAPSILVVDDDRGGTRQVKMTSTLDSLGEVYSVWDVSIDGTPSAATLKTYPIVFWMTGDSNSDSPTPDAVQAMQSFLDDGGELFLTGQDIAENLSERPDSTFLRDYLGVTFHGNEQFAIGVGVNGNVIGDGLQFNGGASDGSQNQSSPDRLALISGSAAEAAYVYYLNRDQIAAVNIENGYHAVFFGFGFEAISSISNDFNTRVEVLAPIIDYLDVDLASGVFDDPEDVVDPASVPREFVLGQNYPNPFNAGTRIPFTLNGPRAQHVRLEIFDILGRRVQVLADEVMEPGRYDLAWDGRDHRGNTAASGVYLYRLSIDGRPTTAKRMVLLK